MVKEGKCLSSINTRLDDGLSLQQAAGSLIRAHREALGMTGTELGRIVRLSQQHISRYERGCCDLTLSNVELFASAFGLTFRQFMDELFEVCFVKGACKQNIPSLLIQNDPDMESDIITRLKDSNES